MKWRETSPTSAQSECGRYEIQASRCGRGAFYNAWYTPTNKHIGASHEKKAVLTACDAHAAKLPSDQGIGANEAVDASQRIAAAS